MKKPDKVFGLVWFVFGVVITIEAFRLGIWKDGSPGSGFIPAIVGVLLGLSGFILTVSATFLKGEEAGEGVLWGNLKNVILPLAVLFIYIFLLPFLGFLSATFLFQFSLLKLTAPRRWVGPILTSLLVVFFCHLVFSVWFKLQLPHGILGIG